MNTSTQAFIFAVASVAAAAAIGMGLADRTAQASTQIVKLERVVIEGKRAQAPTFVAQLPRVVIEGRRTATAEVQMAAAQPANKTI